MRYDYTFGGTQSVSLKWLHNDWNYMASAQENIALEYNAYVPVESLGTGGYFTLGIYQRWLKQSWNNNYQNPFSLDTDDTSMFLAATFGILFKVGSEGSFITIDLNNRDTFNFYNSDDVGTDLSYYWKLESENFIRLIAGTRWSGFFTFLPGYATTNYVGAAYSF